MITTEQAEIVRHAMNALIDLNIYGRGLHLAQNLNRRLLVEPESLLERKCVYLSAVLSQNMSQFRDRHEDSIYNRLAMAKATTGFIGYNYLMNSLTYDDFILYTNAISECLKSI